jgi:Serine/threonine protein kinase
MIGYELGGRYEIIERVGGGGMALVYRAQDILLGRNVAVKILRQQFVHDEEFVRRFRREAQAAASLSHPNIVSVYDVGQQDDTHYIVMEYVEGRNLNDIIKERAPLQPDEAVRIAAQICDALDHAHNNQIIHRDIKPHNILIGKNGRVKVTDFGIARAVTSSTITQTGSVVGSVHYLSPEHAKGVVTGEKSDLYSLGVVLYQMVTGRLPFLGESPISVALKHLQDGFEEPRQVNPHIPQSLENVILRAMRKNPGERYDSAREMLDDLETCLSPERLDEPKLAFDDVDMETTRIMPAIRSTGEAQTSSHARESGEDDAYPDSPEWIDDPKPRRWVKPLAALILTGVFVALAIWGVRMVRELIETDEVDVPYVVGMQEAAARERLAAEGLNVQEPVIYEENDEVPAGVVISQNKANMRVKAGSPIQLTVSSGPKLETMEDFVGRKFAEAQMLLEAAGVEAVRIEREDVFDEAEPGDIIEQSVAAGERYDPKTVRIKFVVSKGLETFDMPTLVGKPLDVALKELESAGLKLGPDEGIVRQPSYKPEGEVIFQFPYMPGDPVAKGSEVTLTVSSGLPEDALRYTFNISISPAVAGRASQIRIEYSDATGEKIDWGTRRIEQTESFPVEVVLSPNTEAIVTIYRDGQFTDSFSITYEEAKAGGRGVQSVPGAPAVRDDQPASGVPQDPGADGASAPETQTEGGGSDAPVSGGGAEPDAGSQAEEGQQED